MAKSILTEYEDISVFSGRPAEAKHHLCFGRGIRNLAEEDGLYIFLTNSEHNLSPQGTINQIHGNPAAEKLSKICGQLAFEKHYVAEFLREHYKFDGIEEKAREAFRKRYGASYL